MLNNDYYGGCINHGSVQQYIVNKNCKSLQKDMKVKFKIQKQQNQNNPNFNS